MNRHDWGDVRFEVRPAWSAAQVRDQVEHILDTWPLPQDKHARVVLKPNLNNDLVALVGNSADLRVLCSLIEGLRNRGYTDLTVADGSNVGVARRGIDSFKRLRVAALGPRYGVKLVDLNHDEGVAVSLHAGARPQIGRTILDADFLISIPKVKTHAEAGLSCALKNWVGICRGQQKRHMHLDLARNIFAINEVVKPDLIVVDGLVGMEGNGPGDGEPFRLGHLFVCNDAFVNDVAVMRLVDFPMDRAPYMRHAQDAGYFDERLIQRIHADLAPLRPIELAPKRSKLAELSEKRSLMWLKLAVRPLVQQPVVAEAAYRAGIIQDVYSLTDDTAALVARTDDCDECGHCEQVCPTHLSWSEIGVKTDQADCMQCLYCWWVCPQGALELSGDLNHLERQVARYKTAVEALACSG